eukprot:713396-Prymnesium_polylepis.1
MWTRATFAAPASGPSAQPRRAGDPRRQDVGREAAGHDRRAAGTGRRRRHPLDVQGQRPGGAWIPV